MASPTNNSNVVANPQLVEYGKFVQIIGDSRFPAISVIDYDYPDRSEAFPANTDAQPITSVSVYPKYAVLTYETNTLGSGGFMYLSGSGVLYTGNFSAILPLTDTLIAGFTGQYTAIDALRRVTLPAGIRVDAPFTAISANNGSAILYYAD